ncbi:MAG: hypothetical protein ACD_2C00139G0003 [uncultured bacterium (gcode 4)]|uniref:Aminotransferase class I/classII large domain-containing protein n=1 Tax=uncultured bacterium (gcode 4) TaxID=1234023 RepID=K2H188_9BACT|nr:MAG: hypothetical protein ACD_2C00139G0003 [uncultured bacterium (gcode 4)]
MFDHIIDSLSAEAKNHNMSLKDILFSLFENQELKDKYLNEIRRSTIVWKIANDILKEIWINDMCKIMAIWDVEYFWEMKAEWENLVRRSLSDINVSDLSGYDLSGQWTPELRNALFGYMNGYYDLSKQNRQEITDSIIPTYGWTDGFVSIMDTLKLIYADRKINFIYPEASFMANVKIAESYFWESSLIKLDKPDKDNFFISETQIEALYGSNDAINVFYLTTVGNPTWSKIDKDDFIGMLKKIESIDNEAIFILDNVYVGILEYDNSVNMFEEIFNDNKLLSRIIFAESLSKTLGTTWLRLGWIWTLNKDYSEELKKNIILKKAWFSKMLNDFIINLLKNREEVIDFQNKVYSFWSSQRLKFMEYIKENHPHFFEFGSSPNVIEREWIYVLLKVKRWYKAEEVFAETWIIGVWVNLSDWLYIRYAFWNVNYF